MPCLYETYLREVKMHFTIVQLTSGKCVSCKHGIRLSNMSLVCVSALFTLQYWYEKNIVGYDPTLCYRGPS